MIATIIIWTDSKAALCETIREGRKDFFSHKIVEENDGQITGAEW